VHELSLAGAVHDTAIRHADGRRVTAIAIRAGAMRQVVASSLEFYFEIVARDTLCEGATLTITSVATELRCRACETRWSPQIPAFRCPGCGGADVAIAAGEELTVDHIEVEQEQTACIASR
jgi:hydrogenase nickel incorporation protein HypA/HybF